MVGARGKVRKASEVKAKAGAFTLTPKENCWQCWAGSKVIRSDCEAITLLQGESGLRLGMRELRKPVRLLFLRSYKGQQLGVDSGAQQPFLYCIFIIFFNPLLGFLQSGLDSRHSYLTFLNLFPHLSQAWHFLFIGPWSQHQTKSEYLKTEPDFDMFRIQIASECYNCLALHPLLP